MSCKVFICLTPKVVGFLGRSFSRLRPNRIHILEQIPLRSLPTLHYIGDSSDLFALIPMINASASAQSIPEYKSNSNMG